jgi:hypothetical protein
MEPGEPLEALAFGENSRYLPREDQYSAEPISDDEATSARPLQALPLVKIVGPLQRAPQERQLVSQPGAWRGGLALSRAAEVF